MSSTTLTVAMVAAFIWGLRHGVDWDHIAAISDITSTQGSARSGIALGTLYAIGHSLMIALLGLAAIAFGQRLPSWVDSGMGFLVGVTLVALGVYVAISINRLRRGKDVRLRSRIALLLDGSSYAYERLRSIVTRTPQRKPKTFFANYAPRTALAVGAVHGIGAETPTQVLLFTGAAGLAGGGAVFLLASFIAGMLVTNTAMILASSLGFVAAGRHKKLIYGAALGTAAFSIFLGAVSIIGIDAFLFPPFFPDPAAASGVQAP